MLTPQRRIPLLLLALQLAVSLPAIAQRDSGKQVEFRVLPEFLAEYRDLPREELAAAGQRVLQMADENIFVVTVSP